MGKCDFKLSAVVGIFLSRKTKRRNQIHAILPSYCGASTGNFQSNQLDNELSIAYIINVNPKAKRLEIKNFEKRSN